MDTARCTLDGVVYVAARFAALPAAELAQKKRFLRCPECDFPAYFKKASRSGQAACFGARPHRESCSMAAAEGEQNDLGLAVDQDILHNPGQNIVIDFNFGDQGTERHNDPAAPENPGGRGGRHIGNHPRPNAVMHRRLSTLLLNLITSEQFRNSRQTLTIPGSGDFAVADFFVNVQEITPAHVGTYHGFWGMIADVGLGRQAGDLWLNTGGNDETSILIPLQWVREVLQRFRVSAPEDITGAYALVFGPLSRSRNGKFFVRVEDVGFLTLRLA